MESEKTPILKDDHSARYSISNLTNSFSIDQEDGSRARKTAQTDFMSKSSISVERQLQIALSWRDVKVSAFVQGKKSGCCGGKDQVKPYTKEILKDVSGVVHPGTLLAIMGASGAGKSTLLNVLTNRNTKGYSVSGDIRLNGWNIGDGIKHVSAYVQQDDLFFNTLTVREQLEFRALLRMDKRLKKRERLERVDEVIHEMGLSKCENSRIGDAGGSMKGISGGERKRLSFASEMLTNPPIFFCDEPTSGLDSFMAQSIVQTLQTMASKGRTILCTIHQPSSDVFSLFNRILLLAEGRTAFFGGPSEAIAFFDKLSYPCPINYNPADHYILSLAIVPDREEASRKQTQAICDAFSKSEAHSEIKADIDSLEDQARTARHHPMLDEAASGESRYQSSWFTQFRYLYWRSWVNTARDVVLFRVRIMQAIVVSLIIGLVYLQIDINQKGIMDVNGAIFLLITFTSMSNMFAVVNTFPMELPIFTREYGSGLYRVDTYYLTKALAEMPVFFLCSVIVTSICYWMFGLYESFTAYLVAVGILLLVANVAVSLGYVISTATGSTTIALSIAPPILIPFLLFGGLFLNADHIPVYFIWLEYLSWFKYSNEVLAVNQWENIDSIPCGNVTTRCFKNGDDVLHSLSFDKDNVWVDVGCLFALFVGFRLLSFIILLIKAKRTKL